MKSLSLMSLGLAAVLLPLCVFAQEDGLRFRTLYLRGMITAYHDENDETARLYSNQLVDDGDKLTTSRDSEVVLRLKGLGLLYLAPKTRIHIERLRGGDKGPLCRIRLITGRVLCQSESGSSGLFEVTAGKVVCHEHGTLFEIMRQEEELKAISFEGSLVLDYHGKTSLAKANESIKLDNGKFRYRNHHLKREEQDHLQAWKDLWAKIQASTPQHP